MTAVWKKDQEWPAEAKVNLKIGGTAHWVHCCDQDENMSLTSRGWIDHGFVLLSSRFLLASLASALQVQVDLGPGYLSALTGAMIEMMWAPSHCWYVERVVFEKSR